MLSRTLRFARALFSPRPSPPILPVNDIEPGNNPRKILGGAEQLEALADFTMNTAGLEPFRLPPLILHPFSAADDASLLMESSKAHLTLQGLLPHASHSAEELDRQLLRGRYAEFKMLFYIGKDVLRWMDQCSESANLDARFIERRIRPETFGVMLVQHIPIHVRTKLETWGVLDFCALFRRAIGLHTVFANLPAAEELTPDFLRRYHRHLDRWYEYRIRESAYDRPGADEFTFELYASGEYTMMLEKSWADPADA